MIEYRRFSAIIISTLIVTISFVSLLEESSNSMKKDIFIDFDNSYSHEEIGEGDIAFGLSLGQERTCAILYDSNSNPVLRRQPWLAARWRTR